MSLKLKPAGYSFDKLRGSLYIRIAKTSGRPMSGSVQSDAMVIADFAENGEVKSLEILFTDKEMIDRLSC